MRAAAVTKHGGTPRGVAARVAATPRVPPLQPVVAVGARPTMAAPGPPPDLAMAAVMAGTVAK